MIDLQVISVVKNEQSFIGEMIASVINTCPKFINLSILVVDDGSTDGTLEVCEKLARDWNFFKYISSTGQGKSFGTYLALKHTSTSWVKCVDGDDFVNFSSLSENDFNSDAFYHDYFRYTKNGGAVPIRLSDDLARKPLKWNFYLRSIPKGMFFFKRRLIDDECLDVLSELSYEDGFINFIICKNARSIFHVDKRVYYYRQHNDNFYGDGGFNGVKTKRLVERIIENHEVFSEAFGDGQVSALMPIYANFIMTGSIGCLARLALCPHLFLKAIIYHWRVKFG